VRAVRCLLPLLAVVLVAGCGGSSTKAPDLLFVSTRDGYYAIYGADANGGHARRLTKEKGDPSTADRLFLEIEPAWSPDGSNIAYISRADGPAHVYVVHADGKGRRRLTDTSMDDEHPSWSPDGRRIVFGREGILDVIPADGGTARRILIRPGNAIDPAWSPDGKLIAYAYRSPGTPVREIYVMRSDGTGVRKLTKLGDVSAAPAWSPDSRRIAFESNAFGNHYEVYTVGLDGKAPTRVTVSESSDTIEPAWSPDGSQLLFSRDGGLWTTNPGGTHVRELTAGKNNDSSPAFRPVKPA
jgi:TolB protein